MEKIQIHRDKHPGTATLKDRYRYPFKNQDTVRFEERKKNREMDNVSKKD
jgi:hypothetical protein